MNLSFILPPSTDPIFFCFRIGCKGFSPLLTATGCNRKIGFWILANRNKNRTTFHDEQTTDGGVICITPPVTCTGTKITVTDATPSDALPDYWCNGTLSGTLPANASFFAAYTCIFNGTLWQCGCTDTACTRSFWQLQGKDR